MLLEWKLNLAAMRAMEKTKILPVLVIGGAALPSCRFVHVSTAGIFKPCGHPCFEYRSYEELHQPASIAPIT
jgi:hypothetical protein